MTNPKLIFKGDKLKKGDKIKIDGGMGFPDFGVFQRIEKDMAVWIDNDGDTYCSPTADYKIIKLSTE